MREKLTVEQLVEIGDMHTAIDFAKEFYGEYPSAPKKPYLGSKPSASEARSYADALEKYEAAQIVHKTQKDDYNAHKNSIDGVVKDFLKEEAGLNGIPEQYREKVWALAWEDGHSAGYYEVYLKLCDLVKIFE